LGGKRNLKITISQIF